MKKTLAIVLALVFVLSVAGTAFAASNPFVDVPAKHWAYDAVSKLAAAGIVDGYGDGTFRGDKTMTRYEMAQIVAKAMAKADKADAANKALIDKLAVEFAKELNNLGVRVAKLEAKTNVGMTFESRIRYGGDDNKATTGTNQFDARQRIYLNGAVNDTVTYGARLEASGVFGQTSTAIASSTTTIPNWNVRFNRAFFNVKDFMGLDQLTVGKFSTLGITNGLLNGKTSDNDGVILTKKMGDVTFKGVLVDEAVNGEFFIYNFDFKTDNVAWNLAMETGNATIKTRSANVGAQIKAGDFFITADYVNTKNQTANTTAKAYAVQFTNGTNGYYFPVTQKIVDVNKPHTDAFALSYRSVEANATPTMSAFSATYMPVISTVSQDSDVKGFDFAYQNVVSKNVTLTLEYADLKQKLSSGTGKDKAYAAYFQFYF